MSIERSVLELLRCPETMQRLQPAADSLLSRLNAQIDAGQLRNRGGRPVVRRCDSGLVREDGRYLYPVCQEIPILILNEAIPLGDA